MLIGRYDGRQAGRPYYWLATATDTRFFLSFFVREFNLLIAVKRFFF